jgi:HTH-like domain
MSLNDEFIQWMLKQPVEPSLEQCSRRQIGSVCEGTSDGESANTCRRLPRGHCECMSYRKTERFCPKPSASSRATNCEVSIHCRALWRLSSDSNVSCAVPVSSSGYYAWHNREPSQHNREDAILAAKVEAAFEHNRRVYGSPRIHAELHAEGIACGQKRVVRLMRELGISAQLPKHRTVTTHCEKGAPVAANLLQRDFHADRPNQKWTTDTTSIWTKVGWLYLAARA